MANVHGFRNLSNSNANPNQNQNRPQAGYNFMGGNSAPPNNQNQGDDENLNIPFMCNFSF